MTTSIEGRSNLDTESVPLSIKANMRAYVTEWKLIQREQNDIILSFFPKLRETQIPHETNIRCIQRKRWRKKSIESEFRIFRMCFEPPAYTSLVCISAKSHTISKVGGFRMYSETYRKLQPYIFKAKCHLMRCRKGTIKATLQQGVSTETQRL